KVDRRTAVLVGDVDRLLGLRTIAIAAEAAAEVTHVEVDVLFRNAGNPGSRVARLLRALVTDPDIYAVVSDKHCRVSRLHAGAREVGRRVGRFDDPGASREGAVAVSEVGTHAAGLTQGRDQRCAYVGRIERSVRGRHIPLDRHLIERRLGLVPAL